MTLKTNNPPAGRGNVGQALDQARAQSAGGAQQQPPAQEQAAPQARQSYGGFLGGMALPAAANPAAETLSRMRQAFDTIYAAQKDQTFDTTLIAIDNETPGISLAVSVLVVCVQFRNQKNAGVGYHALLLEATGDTIPPLQVPVGQGTTVNLTRTVGDAYDQIMQGVIVEQVQRAFPSSPLYSADAEYVPRDFKMEDVPLLQRLAANAVIAAATELGKNQSTYQPFTISGAQGDTSLSVNTTFNNPETADAVGRPVRSDIKLQFRTGPTARAQGANQSLNLEKPQDIATLTAFCDLVHQPKPVGNPFTQAAQQQYSPAAAAEAFKQYYIRVIITQMKVGRNMTLPMQVMGLVTASTLREPGATYNAFAREYRQERAKDKDHNIVDLRDVGIIGVELNIDNGPQGERINTKSETFTKQNLGELLSAATYPGTILSLDVADVGEETWFNGGFARAAMGDIDANREILEATDVLTGGIFGEIYKGDGTVCTSEDNRIQLGYYRDQDGVFRDLRVFDYVAAANLYEANHDRAGARDWTASFLQTQYPIEQRLAARERIMRNFFTQVEVTGYATRCTFVTTYLDALMAAVEQCKLKITEVSPFSDAAAYDLPTYQYANRTVSAPMQSSVFQRGFNRGNATQGYRPTGRWA